MTDSDVEARWQALRAALDAERVSVQEQIAAYSAPVPAGDAVFGFLLEQRTLLREELVRLDEARAEAAASADPGAAYDAFVDSLRTDVGPH